MKQPSLLNIYIAEFKQAISEAISSSTEASDDAHRQINALQKKIDALLEVLENGERIASVTSRIRDLEEKIGRLKLQQRNRPKTVSLNIPQDLSDRFAAQIADLQKSLNADSPTRSDSAVLMRSMFREIRVHPRDGRGNVAIEIEAQPHVPWLQGTDTSGVMLKVVAEEGLEPPTPGL